MELGQFNTLEILRFRDQGCYLGVAGQEDGGVLLPGKEVDENWKEGDTVEVFIYQDSEERLIATTKKPLIALHKFAFLQVKDETPIGTFMDWGLEKDLFVPFAEQDGRMKVGEYHVIFLFLDVETSRLVGSSRVEDIIDNEDCELTEKEEVSLLFYRETQLGYQAIINGQHIGLLFKSDVHKDIAIGDTSKGYIKKIREDGKITLAVHVQGVGMIDESARIVLEKLKENGGHMNFTDKSDPVLINKTFGMSKKSFKRGVGALYKQRIVELKDDGIHLLDE